MIKVIAAALLLMVSACSQPAPRALDQGSWTLQNEVSSLSFVSVKASDIGEAHGFSGLGGSVAADGTATLTIDLTSVDTGIEIRDERMREFLFETAIYPQAMVTAQIDPSALSGLAVGASKHQSVSATLDLHGVSTQVDAEVAVLRAGPDKVIVATARPIILDIGALGLSDGVEQLKGLAELPAISAAVPVTFSLTFTR